MARLGPIVVARNVVQRYGDAGGGLLAGGLAYAALFAIVPTILLAAGLAGVIIADPSDRTQTVDTISRIFPPLRDLIEAILSDAAQHAAPISIIGVAFLAWGASRFVVSFFEAIDRVMGAEHRRGILSLNADALLAVVLMIAALLAGTVAAGVAAFLEAGANAGVLVYAGALLRLVINVTPLIASIVVVAVVYRTVPSRRPPWRVVRLPALVVGLVVGLLTQAFVFLAPRLIGAAALVGSLATAFAALAWLSLSFQAILLGAAWVRERWNPAAAEPPLVASPAGFRSGGRTVRSAKATARRTGRRDRPS